MVKFPFLAPAFALACGALLVGCVVAPPPMIAFPGQGKTYPAFQQDDAECRAAALQATRSAQLAPGAPLQTANLSYAQCMTAHGDRVGAAPPPVAVAVPAYQPVPVYPGYGDPYSWQYGGGVAVGIGGGF